jgi:ATP-dependent DNA helicase RecQ
MSASGIEALSGVEIAKEEWRERFAPRCVSIDLEVSPRDGRLHSFAAVRSGASEPLVFHKGDLVDALNRLDAFSDGADFVLGHNLVKFDLPKLASIKPGLRLLSLPAVDTLWLNPLAFPRNPYHHLVKHYQDGQLKHGRLNDPELDARLTLDVLGDQYAALQATDRNAGDLVCAWHWLTTCEPRASGVDAFFATLRGRSRPEDVEALSAIGRLLTAHACITWVRRIVESAAAEGWALSYALAWLSVAGGNSVMPPWVRHQFPMAGKLIQRLRDTACSDPDCGWCREHHDARGELKRWFGASLEFRLEPVDRECGRPLQEVIVESAMRGEHLLGILPTGTGKSLCYQIPALSRYEKTGALTVVISPLVALMADQVAGLEARGHTCCAAFNGLLTMPERADVLDRIRLGDVGILITSPEQLRNRSLRQVLAQREIGAWVLDEAHCLSKWGHDFRPDYRYVGRFIHERAGDGSPPPILCLTATAKPEVVDDIANHFHKRLGLRLRILDGGATRDNLDFDVIPTTQTMKFEHVHQALEHHLPGDQPGGAIVYCATRRQTEEVAEFLRVKEIAADYYHAGLQPETKKSVQERFIRGELRVISATNAFGMGIDKPDVRLVIHADIPGSLENYLQEAGRAGRDRQQARCVLMYTLDDVERQFGMSARSRLSQRDIQTILDALRRLDRKKRLGGEVVATAGEVLAEDEKGQFERDSATEDTRVKTAISWLEEVALLTREENRVQVFPSSLRIGSIEEARDRLHKQKMTDGYRRQLLALVDVLIEADPDDGISTDELMLASGLSAEQVRVALFDLERLGIASNDTAITALVHAGVARASTERFAESTAIEAALIDLMREDAPDLAKGEESLLHLRIATQKLKDDGHSTALPEKVLRLLRSIAADGRGEDGGIGSISLKMLDRETLRVRLQREWQAIAELAERRRQGARLLLDHLIGNLPTGSRGTDLLVETTLGKLFAAMETDLFLKSQSKNPQKLLDRALLWLHEQEVIRLNKGLAVFRPAMTIKLSEEKRNFAKVDFEPLKQHYHEKGVQIHVMAEYAQRGLEAIADAVRLAADYFALEREAFIAKWLPNREKELGQLTTPESWRRIVEDLGSPIQQRIVADDREQTNVLVLAGPGSGKTRVLVHRIGYLVRVRRESPDGILALAYNHHAAVDIRRRLRELIGDDACGVTVLTCHALAMRLTGASFAGRRLQLDESAFEDIVQQAIDLLEGKDLPPDEADAQRDRLLAGFRWILVDEYQDIGADQYRLISAIAGRSRQDDDAKLTLFAVGDDDQNIYTFAGASVEFIRRFETDYTARPIWLVENYRSTAHIVAAANRVIVGASDRLKADHPITIDRKRRHEPAGGAWAQHDRAGQGRVQIMPGGDDPVAQAVVAVTELQRLANLDPDWDWSRTAVIAREWRLLDPVRAVCELHGIPAQSADEDIAPFWRLREVQSLVEWLRMPENKIIKASAAQKWLHSRSAGPWWSLILEAVGAYEEETDDAELPADCLVDWLVEWGRDIRRKQAGLLLLTAHRAKGLQFDHVVVLDGGWDRHGRNEDHDASRRLYYVAMTRAKSTLTLTVCGQGNPFVDGLRRHASVLVRPPMVLAEPPEALRCVHRRLGMSDVDLGFAGRHSAQAPVHRAIAALEPGSPLRLQRRNDRWELLDPGGTAICRLAKSFNLPRGMRCKSAHVVAVVIRRREETAAEYLDGIRCERWETVLPGLVLSPGGEE